MSIIDKITAHDNAEKAYRAAKVEFFACKSTAREDAMWAARAVWEAAAAVARSAGAVGIPWNI